MWQRHLRGTRERHAELSPHLDQGAALLPAWALWISQPAHYTLFSWTGQERLGERKYLSGALHGHTSMGDKSFPSLATEKLFKENSVVDGSTKGAGVPYFNLCDTFM